MNAFGKDFLDKEKTHDLISICVCVLGLMCSCGPSVTDLSPVRGTKWAESMYGVTPCCAQSQPLDASPLSLCK